MTVPIPKQPLNIYISKNVQSAIRKLADQMYIKYKDVHNCKFRRMLFIEAGQLPMELLTELIMFKEAFGYEDFGAIVLKKFWDVNQDLIGKTPERWNEVGKVPEEVKQELTTMQFAFALVHGVLGSIPMQWKCQRGGGGLGHSVIPDVKMKKLQVGSGSTTDLAIHTEDACLTNSADFISLFWIRNFERVPSYLYSLRSTDWEKNKKWEKILRKPIFTFRPDANYLYTKKAVEKFDTKMMPVIYGNKIHPWFRSDYIEMKGNQQSIEATYAIEWLEKEIQSKIYSDFAPDAGDLVLVNNKMIGHGRGKFNAGISPEGHLVDRRWMIRMMSHTSPMQAYAYGEPGNPFIINELLGGYLYRDFIGEIRRR